MPSRRGIRLKHIKVVKRAGNRREIYFRHPSGGFIRLPDLPENHPDFVDAYQRAAKSKPAPKGLAKEGSIRHVAAAYTSKNNPTWSTLAASSREGRQRIINKIVDKAGHVPIEQIRDWHIANDIDELRPFAARDRLKAWRALMAFAKRKGFIANNPAKLVDPPPAKSGEHRAWTDDEIQSYRDRWTTGTKQRMALELALWSGARRGDVVGLGRQQIKNGELTYTQQKTGVTVTIPTLPAFEAELSKLPADQLLFLQAQHGGPHSAKAFGAWFRKACNGAGLPTDCVFHGLRKTRAKKMKQAGIPPEIRNAWLGHVTLTEAEHYARGADTSEINRRTAEQERKQTEKLEQKSTLFQKSRKSQ